MPSYLTLILSLFLYVTSTVSLIAQSNDLNLSSNTAVVYNNEQVHYTASMGEAVVVPLANDHIILSQGFYQGEVLVWSGEEPINYNLISVYPNPTFNTIKINLEESGKKVILCLFDALGNKIFNEHIPEDQSILTKDLSQLPSGYYFLTFVFENADVKTYKIFKAE